MKKISYVLALALVLSGFAFFNSAKADNNNGMMNGGGNSNAMMNHEQDVRATGSTLEVHFYDNGSVLVRGAKVTAITGNVVSATMSWGPTVLNWTVNLASSSKVVRKFGGAATASEIAIGDILSFQGNLDTANAYTVNATTIKNWSIQKKQANFNGIVKSVDATGMKFVLTPNNGGDNKMMAANAVVPADVTVLVTSSTKINKGELKGSSALPTFADIVVGAQVSARGVLDTVSNQLTADTVGIKQNHSGQNQGGDNANPRGLNNSQN